MTTPFHILSFKSSSLRGQLFRVFFTNPDERLFLREIARRIKADPANLSRELGKLEKEGLFVSEKEGLQKYYRLDKNYPLYNELKSIVGKTVGVQAALQGVLKGIQGITWAFIYGSFAKGTEASHSDIDVCLIIEKGKFKSEKVLTGFKDLEGKLGREISYVFYNQQEWEKGLKNKDSFLIGLNKGKKIELVKHDKA